jgi:flagellar capping protein FliD
VANVLVAFERLPIDLKLNEIHNQLNTLMAREQELEALVAQNGVAISTLSTEVSELKTSGNAMNDRWAALSAAQTAAIDALTAEVQAAREGAVSPEKLAELQATTDAAVANAAAAKAASDEATAAWDAAAQPA